MPEQRVMEFLSRLGCNLLWGMRLRLIMGVEYCLIGVLLLVDRGPRFLDPYGITFGTLMLVYLGGGLAAGAVMGLGRPLTRWRLGAIATGIACGIVAYGGVAIAMQGWIAQWGVGNWIIVAIGGVSVGTFIGNWAWERYVEPTLPRPPLPPGPPPPRRPLGMWHP